MAIVAARAPEPEFVEPAFSTYDIARRGPEPCPGWLVTDRNALDTDLGVLRPARGPTSTWSSGRCPAGSGACSPRSGTAPASTACSTATPGTRKAGRCGAPVTTAPWNAAPTTAAGCWPGSGRLPSSVPSCSSGRPERLLVHDGRLVMIDVPQIVDLVANPQGPGFLERDCHNVCRWFTSRGLGHAEPDVLFGELMAEAVASW